MAQCFGYTENYIYLLRHQFQHGKIDFSEPVSEEKAKRRKVDAPVREKICNWREHRLSAGEIVQLLSEEGIDKLSPWKRIHVPHVKRKYPNPIVHDAHTTIDGYEGPLRQIVLRGNGHEKPAVLITNDFESPVELIVGNYSRRWRVENAISEAVRFFSLNALSSPILVKIHFDVALTMVADTLYSMLARKLRGFEDCDAPKIYRSFVKGKAGIKIEESELTVTYPRRAHNPILRNVPWHRLPGSVPWLDGIHLNLKFS